MRWQGNSSRAKEEEITLLVGLVENSTQIHLSNAERASLVFDLHGLGESIQQLKQRGENVKRAEKYGRLSLDIWLKSQVVYTIDEVNKIVEQQIERRRMAFESSLVGMKLNEAERNRKLAEIGLMEVGEYWRNQNRAEIELHVERIESKCKKLRAQFYHLPEQAKIDLWAKAVQNGLVSDGDRFAELILPSLVPRMITDFEEAIKNNSVKVTT